MRINLYVLGPFIIYIISCVSCSYYKQEIYNHNVAHIAVNMDSFVITVFSEKKSMVHDPASLLQQKTYIDSCTFKVPRNEGAVEARELPSIPGNYPYVKGKIVINKDSVKINLFFDDFDDKKIVADEWNGSYVIR